MTERRQMRMPWALALVAMVAACAIDRAPKRAGRSSVGTVGHTAPGDGGTSNGDGDGTLDPLAPTGDGDGGDGLPGDGDGDGVPNGDGDGDGVAGTAGNGNSTDIIDDPGSDEPTSCAEECSDDDECDANCDDLSFCNGNEQCKPGSEDADAFGCVQNEPPCGEHEKCNEPRRSCEFDCTAAGDLDGDGFVSMMCGGPDCDDGNALTKPGAIDRCNGIDDDCDGDTDGSYAQRQCLFIPSGLGSCVAGTCAIRSCANGFDDCDGSASNGCETDLDPTRGDCQVTDCFGQELADDGDRPDGSDACHTGACDDGKPIQVELPDGTPCGSSRGCDAGACVDLPPPTDGGVEND